MLDPKTNSNYKQNSTFIETLQDKLKNIKNFSNWSAKEQMVTATTIGTIFGVLFPVVTIALPVAATGAAVALTLFFTIKAVEYGYKGLKWSSEKTWKGSKYTTGKIKDGTAYIKDSVKKSAHLIRDRITDARNALAVAIYDDREKYEDRSEIKKAAANKKEDCILKSSLQIRNNMFYGDDISKSRKSATKKTTNVIKYQPLFESGAVPTTTIVERKPSDKETIPVPTSIISETNLSSSSTQGEKSDYVVINMKDRNTGCVDFDYYSNSSQRSSLNSSIFSTPTNEQNLSMEALQNEFERRFAKLHTSPNKLMKQQTTPSTQLYEQEHTQTIRNRLETLL